MRHIEDLSELELDSAEPWRPSGFLLAQVVTYALGLLAVGVLFGAYLAAASHF